MHLSLRDSIAGAPRRPAEAGDAAAVARERLRQRLASLRTSDQQPAPPAVPALRLPAQCAPAPSSEPSRSLLRDFGLPFYVPIRATRGELNAELDAWGDE